MAYATKLKEQAHRLACDIQDIVNLAEKENDRGLTSDELVKFNKLVTDHSAVEASIKVAETSNDIISRLAGTPAVQNKIAILGSDVEELQDTFRKPKNLVAPKDSYGKAFANYMRNGERDTTHDDKATMKNAYNLPRFKNAQTVTTTGGGYLIPAGFADQLEIASLWFGGIKGTVDEFTTSTGNVFPYPQNNDTTNKGRILGINTQVTETDFAFTSISFNAYVASSDLVLVPIQLIEDSYFDIDAMVTSLLGTRLGRNKNYYCTVGSGSSQPTGIVTAAVTAGSIYVAGGGSTSGETSTFTYADLVNLEHTVDPSYRSKPSAKFMFNDVVLKGLKLLVDGNSRPLWQPGLVSSFREGAGVDTIKPTILDHDYVINQDMAVPASAAVSMLFGDMSKFKVRTVDDVRLIVMHERYMDYLQLGYTAFIRYDSNLVDAGTHPVAVFKQSTT